MVQPLIRSAERVGLLGCGRMGAAMGGHLLDAGTPLAVYDPAAEACAPLVERGATACRSPAEVAAESDVVLTAVVDDAQVKDALASAFEGAREGTILAICASVRPDTCRELAAEGARRGLHVLDAALVRGERGAEEGRLVLYCGGDAEAISMLARASRSRKQACVSGRSAPGKWRRRPTTASSGRASARTSRRSASAKRSASSRRRCATRWRSE